MARKKTGRPRGAPPGNLNAFKHGRRSRRLAATAALLATDSRVAESFAYYSERADRKKTNNLEAGMAMLRDLITRAKAAGAAQERNSHKVGRPRHVDPALPQLLGPSQPLMDQQIAGTAPSGAISETNRAWAKKSPSKQIQNRHNRPRTIRG